MGKHVSLNDTAVNLLDRYKKPGESYSQLIIRTFLDRVETINRKYDSVKGIIPCWSGVIDMLRAFELQVQNIDDEINQAIVEKIAEILSDIKKSTK